jgi:hypothetical protein
MTILQQLEAGLSAHSLNMKILHALVGYLAVTALPFHPFAFSSPLEPIHYDGYVDTTQNHIDGALMNHDLVETYRTPVTYHTGSDHDSALIKRIPGDIIEERQLPAIAIPLYADILAIIGTIFLIVLWISDDIPVRGNDVELLVRALIKSLLLET